jgi:hypothetical protein
MMKLLEFYEYFLSVKEQLVHSFNREQILLKNFHQERSGFKSVHTFVLFPGNMILLERTFYWLKEGLAGFTVLLSKIQKHQKPNKGPSMALNSCINELENFSLLLEAYKISALEPIPR